MSRRLVVALVLVAAALAGCLADTSTGPASSAPGGNETDGGPADGADPGPGSAPNASDPAEVLLDEISVDWDGSTGAEICLPSGPNACSGAGTPDDSTRDLDAPEPSGAHAGWNRTLTGTLNLSWSAEDPTTEEMSIHLAWTESCGDTCTVSHTIASARGASPVQIALDRTVVPGNRSLEISVGTGNDLAPDPVYTDVHTEQSFHVGGELVVSAVDGEG